MKREIVAGVYEVGVRDFKRRTFDDIIPLPDGTSYNSYVVQGLNKTALIDSVDPLFCDELLSNLNGLHIDYVIANHAEQDHSGSIGRVLEMFPNAKVVCNEKCRDLLVAFLHISPEKFQVVNDGDTLDLGYKNLQFIFTPWVHWPETMCSYLIEEKILFSCDFFGAHIASDELFVGDEEKVMTSAKRYYAEIMMPFRAVVRKNVEKVCELEIKMIAPSHGQVYGNPSLVVDAYKNWTSDSCANKVVLGYVTMHNSTKIMAEYINSKLIEKNINVVFANVSEVDLGVLAGELIDAKGIILATPAFLTGMHPKMASIVFLVNALKPKANFFGVVGSFGWGHVIEKQMLSMLPNIKAEFLDSVFIKGMPKSFDELDNFVKQIEEKMKN